MCTLIMLYRPDHPWPMLIAANRDEMLNRPWQPPCRHWPDQPNVVAGLDERGKGSWFGLNDNGVVASIMNRRNTLGPVMGKRSRGELVLKVLDYTDAKAAAEALSHTDMSTYRAFNLVIADSKGAYWLRHTEAGNQARIDVTKLAPGLSMITAYDCNDMSSPRVRRYLPLFLAAPVPAPERDDWSAWKALLVDRESDPGTGPYGAMNIVTDHGFGTVSSLLVALPARERPGIQPRWLFAAGRPDLAPFNNVTP
jgi:uncharacterized protein with NRDE domain